MVRGGIFGPSLSGKTTLAKALSMAYWAKSKIRSLVLDPNQEQWGAQAWVTTDEEKFWDVAWKTTGSLVIVDESTETINRDKGLVAVFTRLRHRQHKLLVIGHSGVNLLPIMRQQIDELFLFKTSPKAAAIWAEELAQPGFLAATELGQYEFLQGGTYATPAKHRLSPGDVKKVLALQK